jgi:predicted ribosomally synthesized peptide with SipW-like signal peptide
LLVIFITTSAVSYAFFHDEESVNNEFNTADYKIEAKEFFPITEWEKDTVLEKIVTISNVGEANVLLRISYNEIWYKENENGKKILNNLVNGTSIVEKKWTDEFLNDFKLINGWYYYTKVLSPNDEVTILESVKKLTDDYSDQEKYELDFHYEVLQAHKDSSIEVWNIESKITDDEVEWAEK